MMDSCESAFDKFISDSILSAREFATSIGSGDRRLCGVLLAATSIGSKFSFSEFEDDGTSLKSSDRRLRAGALLAAAFSRERFAQGEMPVGELESLLEFDVT